MAQFIQIGQTAVNLDLVRDIYFAPDLRIVRLYGQPLDADSEAEIAHFYGDEYDTFVRWWNERGPVTIYPMNGDQPQSIQGHE